MNILYITQLLPHPADSGGKIKTLATLRAIAQKHTVVLVSFITNKSDREYGTKIKRLLRLKCVYMIYNPLVVEKNLEQQLWVMFKSLWTRKPYALYKFWNTKMKNLIGRVMATEQFDYYWFDHLSMAQYLPPCPQAPCILENHNVEHLLYLRHAHNESKKIWKLFFYIESYKYWLYEHSVSRRFQTIFMISETDKKFGPAGAHVLPPAVSDKFFTLKRKPQRATLVFVGLLTWYPNRQGLLWFVRDVLPLIQKSRPGVRCIFVGDKSKRFPIKQTGAVLLTGHVKNIMPYLSRATVFIAPVLFGSGVRIKILEAMACGLPVVSTTIGAEGIGARHGREILLADTPGDFAQCVNRLLDSKIMQNNIGSSAKTFISSHYTHKQLSAIVENTLRQNKL